MTAPLTSEDIDELADAIADRLGDASERLVAPAVVDAATLASRLGVSSQWVRDHAEDLGGWRLGDGPKAPYRFDAHTAIRAMRISRGG